MPPKTPLYFFQMLSGWQQPCNPITYLFSPSTPCQEWDLLEHVFAAVLPFTLGKLQGLFKAGPSDNQNVKSGLLSLTGTRLPYERGCTLQLPAQAAYQAA